MYAQKNINLKIFCLHKGRYLIFGGHMKNLLLLGLLIGCGGKDDTGLDEETTSTETDLANGQSVFDGLCMGCHASNGTDIVSESASLSDDQLEDIIVNGSGSMAAQSSLSADDVRDVIAYIRTQ
jgi:cytochrome c551